MSSVRLPQDLRLDTPGALLDALAFLVSADAPSDALWSGLPRGREGRAAAVLGGRLAEVCAAAAPAAWPSSEPEQVGWLHAVERASLATETLARLDGRYPWAASVRAALLNLLEQRRASLRSAGDLWRHAQRAALRRAEVGDRLPWSEVPAALPGEPASAEEVLAEWLLGTLSDEQDRSLRQKVTSDGVWTQAYVRRLQAWAAEVRVLAVEEPRVLLRLPLAHLGRGVFAWLQRTDDGLSVTWPGAEAQHLPATATQVTWPSDWLLGSLTTRLVVLESDTLGRLSGALQNARKALAAEESVARSLALQAAGVLSLPSVLEAMAQAADRFRRGSEENLEELRTTVQYAVEVRATLEAWIERCPDPALLDAVERCDEALQPFSDALFLVPETTLSEALQERWPVFDGWWGRRPLQDDAWERIERALLARGQKHQAAWAAPARPSRTASRVDPEVALALGRIFARLGQAPLPPALPPEVSASLPPSALAAPAPPKPLLVAQAASTDVLRLLRDLQRCPESALAERFQEANEALKKTACPWLHPGLLAAIEELTQAWSGSPHRLALATTLRFLAQPVPGAAPVLAALEQLGLASLWELRIRKQTDRLADPWVNAGPLRGIARDAVRDAYFAVASLLPGRLAPAALEQHSFHLLGADPLIDALDGPSLALSAALAFASLWTDTPLPPDLAASGRLLLGPGSGARVLPVGWVREKEQRLQGSGARLLVAEDDVLDSKNRMGVGTLEEAIRKAKLPLAALPADAAHLPLIERRRLVDELCKDIESQRLDPYVGLGRDPWQVAADQLRRVVLSLETEEDRLSRQSAAKGRAYAALAYTHAMEEAGARTMLAGDVRGAPPAVECFAHMVACGVSIDRGDWQDCHRWQETLAQDLEHLSRHEREHLSGMVLGTRGRAWMHERRLDLALPLLRAAVEHHEQTSPREVGRSRIYVAMALRMSGQAQQAIEELEKAASDVFRCRREDPVYAVQTEMFLHYELARSLLSAGLAEQAVQAGERALSRARQTGAWWPLLGILRTLVWAYGELGRPEEAMFTTELRGWADRGIPLAKELLQEAIDGVTQSGEVY